ncbi:MAG: preprotein translocase subunit YajC [Actinomycetota bacterium]|jgi:preprotein translocase subunit YajC|nr:preprotein translocase subunit YajC [Actinomycetota bacterium]
MKVSRKIVSLILITAVVLVMGLTFTGCFPMGTTGTEGQTEAQAEPPEGAAGFLAQYGTWIWLIVLVVAFYFLLIRPQRQRSKKAQELLTNIKRGDEILTVGGFYGKVKDVREDSFIVTLSSGVDVKISKSAVSKKVS